MLNEKLIQLIDKCTIGKRNIDDMTMEYLMVNYFEIVCTV